MRKKLIKNRVYYQKDYINILPFLEITKTTYNNERKKIKRT